MPLRTSRGTRARSSGRRRRSSSRESGRCACGSRWRVGFATSARLMRSAASPSRRPGPRRPGHVASHRVAAQGGRHAGGEHRLATLDQRRSRPRCECLGNDLRKIARINSTSLGPRALASRPTGVLAGPGGRAGAVLEHAGAVALQGRVRGLRAGVVRGDRRLRRDRRAAVQPARRAPARRGGGHAGGAGVLDRVLRVVAVPLRGLFQRRATCLRCRRLEVPLRPAGVPCVGRFGATGRLAARSCTSLL